MRDTVWPNGFIHVESRYDVSYFIAVSRSDKYRNITLMFEIIGEVLLEIHKVLLSSFSN